MDPLTIRVHPLAFLKLQILCACCPTEVGAYARTSPSDPFLILDFIVPKQTCTGATFEFDPLGIPDLHASMEEAGVPVEDFTRIIAHTHPGNSATPSSVDWDEFRTPTRQLLPHWGMLIMAKNSTMTFHLGVCVSGHPLEVVLPVAVATDLPLSMYPGDLSRDALTSAAAQISLPPRPTIISTPNNFFTGNQAWANGNSRALQRTSSSTPRVPPLQVAIPLLSRQFLSSVSDLEPTAANRTRFFGLGDKDSARHTHLWHDATPTSTEYANRLASALLTAADHCDINDEGVLSVFFDESSSLQAARAYVFARAYCALPIRDQRPIDNLIAAEGITGIRSGDDIVALIMTYITDAASLLA